MKFLGLAGLAGFSKKKLNTPRLPQRQFRRVVFGLSKVYVNRS